MTEATTDAFYADQALNVLRAKHKDEGTQASDNEFLKKVFEYIRTAAESARLYAALVVIFNRAVASSTQELPGGLTNAEIEKKIMGHFAEEIPDYKNSYPYMFVCALLLGEEK